MKSIVFVFLLFICVMTQVHSFQISRLSQHHRQSSTIMNAKSPSPKPSPVNPVETTSEEPKRAINLSNLLQLVLMGAGAPGLGEFDRMDENGKMFFKLEANNFVDSKVSTYIYLNSVILFLYMLYDHCTQISYLIASNI